VHYWKSVALVPEFRAAAAAIFSQLHNDSVPEHGHSLGQNACSLSILHFLPELARTLLSVIKEDPPQVVVAHDSQLLRKMLCSMLSDIHSSLSESQH
jgi:hypothetical protein